MCWTRSLVITGPGGPGFSRVPPAAAARSRSAASTSRTADVYPARAEAGVRRGAVPRSRAAACDRRGVMKIATGVTLLIIGATLLFAVHGSRGFVNLHAAGLVLI